MKENSTATFFWAPGTTDWEWWRKRPGDPVALPTERPAPGTSVAFGIPASQCSSIPVWVNSADPAVTKKVLQLELERLGIALPTGLGTHLAWRVVGTSDARRLVHAVVIPREVVPQGSRKNAKWEAFLLAPLMVPARPRAIVVWQELDRWVAGFSREGQWVHFQSLGGRKLDLSLLHDLRCLYLELDGRRMVDRADTLVLWNAAGTDPIAEGFADQVGEVLNLDLRVVEKPPLDPRLAESLHFEPGEIADARRRTNSRRHWFRATAVAAVFYSLLVVAGFWDLYRRQNLNDSLRERVATLEPTAETVREIRSRWSNVEPALEVNRYPVELFYRVAKLFPEKGLRMTSFEITDSGQIVVRGEASSVPVAIRFKADLQRSPALGDYEWDIPQPEITGATAEFVAFGTYRFASPEANRVASTTKSIR